MRLEDAPGHFQKRWNTMLAPYTKDFPLTTDVPSPSGSDKSTGPSERQLKLIIDESLLKFRMSPKAIGLTKIVRPALHAICDSIKRDPFVEDHVAEAVLQKQIRMYQDDLTFLGFLWEWLVRIFLLSSWIVAQRWWLSFENFKSEAPSNELSARLLSRCAEFLQELSIYFLEMYNTNNVIGYIHLAVNISQLAANITPDNHFRKGAYLNQLAKALHTRFQRLENASDIECAVAIRRTAIDLTPENHPSKATYLNSLGAFVHSRFISTGNLADIEDDITVTRRALELTPDGHKSKPVYLRSLGISLNARYRRLRNLSDVSDAIALHRKATTSIPISDPTRAAYFHCLAISLKNRFDHPAGRPQRTFTDIEDAIAAIRVAVALTSDEKPEKRIYLVCLGDCLWSRHEERMWPKAKDLIDLKDSIVVFRQALDLTPDSHPAKPAYLAKLGIALRTHFTRTKAGFSAEIEDAITTLRKAVALSSDDDPGKSICLRQLGLSLETQLLYQQVKSIRDLKEAFNIYMQAATQEVASPDARLLAAKWCAGLCWRYYFRLSTQDMLFQIYRCALPLIPQVAGLGHSISHRYEELANLGDVANSAAAIAIAAGQFELAVEWLEAGRGIVWGQIMRLRTRTDELHSQHPELGERLQATSRALSTVDKEDFVQYTVHGGLRLAPSEETSSKRAVAQEYQRILTEIRSKAGFERFLLPRAFKELAPPPGTGFIVVVNAYERRCDAVIISASRIVHVPLLTLSFELAEQMHINLLFSLSHSGVRGRAFKQPTRKAMTDDDKLMRRVLERLWTLVVEPILEIVDTEFSDVLPEEGLPHITWCATGPLAFLPFHAAGIYAGAGRTSVSRPRNAFDRVVSSYTPTLSALAHQFRGPSSNQSQTPANILVISQPETPGFDPIPNTVHEAQKVVKHFPPDSVVHLSGATATVDTALQVLDENRPQIVHLACHGVQDISQPTNSAFMMHNGPLHLSSLMAKAIDGADLAFLSACQSATGHDRLSEESVHLAAGMLAVGYRAVIGTMWSIGDGDAPLVADEFYARLRSSRDGMATEVAYALHGAVAKLREKVGEDDFIRWVPFVHFGR